MAEVGSPEWIEQSLAQLDELERERDKHEAALEQSNDAESLKEHSEAIERLDAEIKSLYEQLEAVAEDGDGEAPQEEVATNEFDRAAAAAPTPVVPVPAPAPAAPPEESPFGSPIAAAADDSPFGSPVAAPAVGFSDPAPLDTSYDDFEESRGGAGKWIAIAVVLLLAVGGGGYYYMTQMAGPKDAPTEEAPKEKVVIEAKEVPDDTQGPKGAQGADVDKTPTSDELAKDKKKTRGGSGGGGSSSGKKKPTGKKKKGIDLSDTDDPLG